MLPPPSGVTQELGPRHFGYPNLGGSMRLILNAMRILIRAESARSSNDGL